MQLLPSLSAGHPKALSKEALGGAHLPYMRHVDDHTIETHDGLLMQFVQLRGLLFETADSDEINYRKVLRDAMLQAIGTAQFALYHHVIRRAVTPEDLTSAYPDPFSQNLDTRWRARLATRKLYVNDLFLTLVYRPPREHGSIVERVGRLFVRQSDDARVTRAHHIQRLSAARDTLIAQLSRYVPRLMSVYESSIGLCSEPLEFLSALYNAQIQPMVLPYADMASYIPARRVSFGEQTLELGPMGDQTRRYQALIGIKDYASQTSPGMFDQLLRLPMEMVVTQSFGFVERGAALSRMNLALRRMRSTDDEALSLRNELGEAKDEVAGGQAIYGEHHMTIAVKGENLADMDAGVAEVQATLADLGLRGVREDIALEASFWAQFPGNFKYIPRRGLISSRNFAGLASCHNFALGVPQGNHWGEAISLMETTAAGPYYFNFHHGDLGNFTVIGPSGSGKTVVLNFLLAQSRKLKPRIIFFDKDRGAEIFIRAIGGRYSVLRHGVPSGLNPLQLDDTPSNRQLLLDWLVQLAGGADEEERRLIHDALDANFAQNHEHRRLSLLVNLLRGGSRPSEGDLYARLTPWWGEGAHAWLFDNEDNLLDFAGDTIGFDMTQILDAPVLRTPAMMILFHGVEMSLSGEKTIIVVDEGWKALDDDVFVQRIRDWEKTIRKRNGIVGFATQSAEDALTSRIASAIIEQAATQIFMVNPKGRREDYVEGFGLSEHEFELVRTLPDAAHCFLVKHGQDSVIVRLDLSGEPELLTILSGRERSVRQLDELRAQVGDDPQTWMPLLKEAAA